MDGTYPGPRPRRRPRKALGQHWLTDRRYLTRIAAAGDIRPDETVVEIGAGTGALTSLLAQRASRLIAVEVDARLAERLQQRFARPKVCIVAADILTLTPRQLLTQAEAEPPYVVIGNLPFFIGTAIVRHFLQADPRPRWLIVTLQAEVAANIAATPGRMTYLSVEMQYFAQPRLLFAIPPRAFRPPPKVHAAVLRLDVHPHPPVDVDDRQAFLRFVQAGFAAPRKHLRNSLALGLGSPAASVERLASAAGIEPTRRPQTLSLDEWAALYHAHRQSALTPPQ